MLDFYDIDSLLSEEERAVRDSVRRFVDERVLPIIATIFIPLTFVAGIYGMNFDTARPWNMPELTYRYGYPVFWLVVIALVAAMLWWFRRKKWL